MNYQFLSFFENNYILVGILVISILRIIPPEWAGFWKYNDNIEEKGRAPRITVINFILTSLFDSVIRAFFLPLLATFGLKNTVGLVILLVVVFDIFVRKQISTSAVTLVSIGIIALYLERLIETGERIELFGKFLVWQKEKKSESETTQTTLKKTKKES